MARNEGKNCHKIRLKIKLNLWTEVNLFWHWHFYFNNTLLKFKEFEQANKCKFLLPDCGERSDVRHSLHLQCVAGVSGVLAHLLHHGGPVLWRKVLQMLGRWQSAVASHGGTYKLLTNHRASFDLLTNQVADKWECANKNFSWVNSKITFDHVGHAYLALFQVVSSRLVLHVSQGELEGGRNVSDTFTYKWNSFLLPAKQWQA